MRARVIILPSGAAPSGLAFVLRVDIDQVRDIWNTVQLEAVWRPMAFVYIFSIFQGTNKPEARKVQRPGSARFRQR